MASLEHLSQKGFQKHPVFSASSNTQALQLCQEKDIKIQIFVSIKAIKKKEKNDIIEKNFK